MEFTVWNVSWATCSAQSLVELVRGRGPFSSSHRQRQEPGWSQNLWWMEFTVWNVSWVTCSAQSLVDLWPVVIKIKSQKTPMGFRPTRPTLRNLLSQRKRKRSPAEDMATPTEEALALVF